MKFFIVLFLSVVYLFGSKAFVSAIELQKKLEDKNLVILDVTDKETFQSGHIPGAINVDAMRLRDQVGKYQLMKSSKEVEAYARELGINNDSKVVIYGHSKSKELLKSSYIALALSVNGLEEISILDGGFNEWTFEFKELVSTKALKPKIGNFTAVYNPNTLVDMKYVKENMNKKDMVESRPKKYYDGEEHSKGVKRLGHIPGAVSSFWGDKFNADDTICDTKELKDIFFKENKLKADKEVVVYCTGGLEASMNWYILTQHLGFKDVKLYDASMREWGNRDDTPMKVSK